MSLHPDQWFATMGKIPTETPEWTPLCAKLDAFVTTFDSPETTTDEVIDAAQELSEAWHAYKQRRFGGKVPA